MWANQNFRSETHGSGAELSRRQLIERHQGTFEVLHGSTAQNWKQRQLTETPRR